MKISIRHRRTYSLAVLCALTSVFLILYGCGDDDNGGGGPPIGAPYSISGKVTLAGSGLTGVTMALSGASSATTTTDNVGNYTFIGLDNGSYTVTPSKMGFTFGPTDNTQTVSGANITGVNFTATQLQANVYNIFGSVYAGSSTDNTGLIGVTMTLSGASSATTTTDIYGTYQFISLANGSYTITPSKPGFTFSPASSTQTVSNADITGVRFAATSTPIGPIVTCPPSGAADVTIQNFAFTPQNVTIGANGIVKWTDSGTTHTVTSGTSPTPDGRFSSGNLGTGDTFCVQFQTIGTYNYFCDIHPSMTGNVIVQ